jgi:hypothetical protein
MDYAARKIGGVGWVVCDTSRIIAAGIEVSELLDQLSTYLGYTVDQLEESPLEVFEATLRLAIASTLTDDRETFDKITRQLAAGVDDTLRLQDVISDLVQEVRLLSARNSTLERASLATKRRVELRQSIVSGGITRESDVEQIINMRLRREGLI